MLLGEPFGCWCRLDLVPDAGASTVGLTLGSIDGRPVPDLDAVRDAWVAELNTLGRPEDEILIRCGTYSVPHRHQNLELAGGRLVQAVADGVAEAAGRGQHGDDAVGAGGVGGAQLGVERRGRRRRGRRRGR